MAISADALGVTVACEEGSGELCEPFAVSAMAAVPKAVKPSAPAATQIFLFPTFIAVSLIVFGPVDGTDV
jgi:hypothetical protein